MTGRQSGSAIKSGRKRMLVKTREKKRKKNDGESTRKEREHGRNNTHRRARVGISVLSLVENNEQDFSCANF